MAALANVQELLVDAYFDDLLDDEEFVLFHELNRTRNPPFPYWKYDPFDLNEMTEEECKAEFRIQKQDIPTLAEALQIPERFTCPQGTIVDGTEGLCMLLKRFAYPCRYSDMISRFGRPVPESSMITTTVMDYIYDVHGHHPSSFNQRFLSPDALETYCEAIHQKGAPLDNCWGFIDGTVRPICRPLKNQRSVYNGHKRIHAIKFQSVVTPNGLIANLFGPVEGKKHDAGMLASSGLLTLLENHSFSNDGKPLCLYGDPAYPLRVHLQAPFRAEQLTPALAQFNRSMSALRVSVEWLFGDVINYFKFLDFKKDLKIGLSAVGKMYIVCALLQNSITCLYGNNISRYFQLHPPEINEYFNN